MARDFNTYFAAAVEAFNEGFTSKAAQKRCLDLVTKAYEAQRDIVMTACLGIEREIDGTLPEAVKTLYYGMPSYPHQYGEKITSQIRAIFGTSLDEAVSNIEQTVELRDAAKAAVIQPIAKVADAAESVRSAVHQMMIDRHAQFVENVELAKLFGGLNVTVNAHYVVNEHGTKFVRYFFYLRGKLTPLNMIVAVAEKLKLDSL